VKNATGLRKQGARKKEAPQASTQNVPEYNESVYVSKRRRLDQLAHDEYFYKRLQAAEGIGRWAAELVKNDFEWVMDILAKLVSDPIQIVRANAASSLRKVLRKTSQMRCIWLTGEWSTSPDPNLRLAVATAMCDRFFFIGDIAVVEHLSRDPKADILLAIARAATIRLPMRPQRYLDVLKRLVLHNRQAIRLAALDGLDWAVQMNLGRNCLSELESLIAHTDTVTAERASLILKQAMKNNPAMVLEMCENLINDADGLDLIPLSNLVAGLSHMISVYPSRSKAMLNHLLKHNESDIKQSAMAVIRNSEKTDRTRVAIPIDIEQIDQQLSFENSVSYKPNTHKTT
jgi:hypothetical protein